MSAGIGVVGQHQAPLLSTLPACLRSRSCTALPPPHAPQCSLARMNSHQQSPQGPSPAPAGRHQRWRSARDCRHGRQRRGFLHLHRALEGPRSPRQLATAAPAQRTCEMGQQQQSSRTVTSASCSARWRPSSCACCSCSWSNRWAGRWAPPPPPLALQQAQKRRRRCRTECHCCWPEAVRLARAPGYHRCRQRCCCQHRCRQRRRCQRCCCLLCCCRSPPRVDWQAGHH